MVKAVTGVPLPSYTGKTLGSTGAIATGLERTFDKLSHVVYLVGSLVEFFASHYISAEWCSLFFFFPFLL